MEELRRNLLAGAIALALTSSTAVAHDDDADVKFSDFTPLAASAGPNEFEGTPLTLGNDAFEQRTIARRNSQLDDLKPNSGVWDMNTVNENGRKAGRYLFTVFESGTSGVQRIDLETRDADTIWQIPPGEQAARFDPMTWTPWGTLITGEENWGCGDGV